jgi:4-aminobutyrate aminotransferase
MESRAASHARVVQGRRLIGAKLEWPVLFESACGATVRDSSGREYLDFTSGYGVANAGWNHPAVLDAMAAQMGRTCFAAPWAATEAALGLAERLLSLVKAGEFICLRGTGGGDAIEAALRVIRAGRGGAARLLTLGHSYHGGGSEPLRLGDTGRLPLPQIRGEHVRMPAPYCLRCPWKRNPGSCGLECAGHVESALDANRDIAAVIVEPVIGSGGVIPAPPGYLARLAAACRQRGVALIVDEVMCGMGRCGSMLVHREQGIEADVVVLGKGLSSGCMPIGAALIRRGLWERAGGLQDVSSTFAWMPLACAAASATIDVTIGEELAARAHRRGELLRSLLQAEVAPLLGEHCGEIRGRGLMVGIELVQKGLEPYPRLAERIAYNCHRGGLMVALGWLTHNLVLMPPLTISEEEVKRGVGLLAEGVERAVGR